MAKSKHARKKKYVNVAEQQRQQDAQYRKFFTDKLYNLCLQIGGEELFGQLSAAEKLILYMFRGAPLKVMVAEGAKIQKRLMDALEKIIKLQQHAMTLEVMKGSGQMMTFADYLLVGMSLERHLENSEFEYPDRNLFLKYSELQYEREALYEKGVLNICTHVCWVFDDIGNKYLHTYSLETVLPMDSDLQIPYSRNPRTAERFMNRDFRMHKKITIGTYPLETRKVSIDGETHSAIQVGVLYYVNREPKLHHLTLPPVDTHVKRNPSASGPELPVYIQQHALDRMRERLGLVIPAFHVTVLVGALLRKDIIPVTKKRMLIACFTDELKIGYFLAEVADGVILIRTFLLLTNGGTPEGNRLSRLTGLQTEDRKYLSIDTLQGLANSDIAQNRAICRLFRDAGCGSILTLCEKINNDPGMTWLLDESQPKNIISDLITEYLKPNVGGEIYVS
ncbi:MAG: hypothetical protein LBL57_01990 [Tannerella sp.]|jgi:hypothetical protein|nr:hypothetical protein [Tannerella sp.]